jgi:hypothetical protein
MVLLLALTGATAVWSEPPNPWKPAPGNPAGMPAATREKAPGVPHETNNADKLSVHESAEWPKLSSPSWRKQEPEVSQLKILAAVWSAITVRSAIASRSGRKPMEFPCPTASVRSPGDASSTRKTKRCSIRSPVCRWPDRRSSKDRPAAGIQDRFRPGRAAQGSRLRKTLPAVLQHLRLAQSIETEIAGQGRTEPLSRSPAR